MRALIVEDEPKMMALVARALEQAGAVSDRSTSGADAVWMAQATAYDVVLPDLDGFEVCRRLRAGAGVGEATPPGMSDAKLTVEDGIARDRAIALAKAATARVPGQALTAGR